jgi:hypothetical protein
VFDPFDLHRLNRRDLQMRLFFFPCTLATLPAVASSFISCMICVSSDCPDLNRFSVAVTLQLPVHPVKSFPGDGKTSKRMTGGPNHFTPVYSSWFGKSVGMLVAIRPCHVPMPCRMASESAAVGIKRGWGMDIRKNLILVVEEVVIATQDQVN